MKWKHDPPIPPTIILRSTNEFYIKEESGIKPNTVRQVDSVELRYIEKADLITIENIDTGQHFTQQITDLSLLGNILGKPLIVISWNPNKVIS
ncbi:hypothetical protein KAW18_18125 [candidate division WOR-3 bacterium]|nr:hypothetical protein [candidate division WOR-3 bacterium]